MRKVQFELEQWHFEALERISHQESRSIADLVRQAVAQLVHRAKAHPIRPLDEIAGKYRPRDTGDLNSHDRSWADAVR